MPPTSWHYLLFHSLEEKWEFTTCPCDQFSFTCNIYIIKILLLTYVKLCRIIIASDTTCHQIWMEEKKKLLSFWLIVYVNCVFATMFWLIWSSMRANQVLAHTTCMNILRKFYWNLKIYGSSKGHNCDMWCLILWS